MTNKLLLPREPTYFVQVPGSLVVCRGELPDELKSPLIKQDTTGDGITLNAYHSGKRSAVYSKETEMHKLKACSPSNRLYSGYRAPDGGQVL